MKRTWSSLTAVAAFALVLGTASLAVAGDAQGAGGERAGSVRAYRQGRNFVVAAYRPDGSATLGIVEAKHVKMERSKDGTLVPNIADLIGRGRVKYTIEVGPGEMPNIKGVSDQEVPPARAPDARAIEKSKPGVKLTPQQKHALIAHVKAARQAMRTVANSLAASEDGAKDGAPSSAPNGAAAAATTNR
jgi:hypothetical protein